MIRRVLLSLFLSFTVIPPAIAEEVDERIEELVDGKCAFCHGEEGESSSELEIEGLAHYIAGME